MTKMRKTKLFDIASRIEDLSEEEIKEINGILKIWKSDIRISKSTKSQMKKIFLEAKGAWDDL